MTLTPANTKLVKRGFVKMFFDFLVQRGFVINFPEASEAFCCWSLNYERVQF